MDSEIPAGSNKRRNNTVALTVVVLATVLGLCKIKDDNIVQAMQQAKADAVDNWNQYQATRLKLHVVGRQLGRAIGGAWHPRARWRTGRAAGVGTDEADREIHR